MSEDEDIDRPYCSYDRDVDPNALREALSRLQLLGEDLYMRMQATNVGMVDKFLTDLEYQVLQGLIDEERTPLGLDRQSLSLFSVFSQTNIRRR